jgi:hypothetical protein
VEDLTAEELKIRREETDLETDRRAVLSKEVRLAQLRRNYNVKKTTTEHDETREMSGLIDPDLLARTGPTLLARGGAPRAWIPEASTPVRKVILTTDEYASGHYPVGYGTETPTEVIDLTDDEEDQSMEDESRFNPRA